MSVNHTRPRPLPRLEDVARRAGVAKSTVSRVLIGEKTLNIREETRQRILEAVRELDYRPNHSARSLRKQRSFSLGVVVPEIDNPVFTTIIQGAQRATLERNYSLLIAYVDRDYPDRELYQRMVHANQVDGLLVTTIQNPGLTAGLRRLGANYILVNRRSGDEDHTVIVDYEAGTRQVVEHLTGLGHRRLGYISGPLAHYTGRRRLAGYRAGLAAAGLPFDPSLIVECEYDRPGAEAAMRRLLDHPDGPPTAVCAANVVVASGILAAAIGRGIAVPDDLSVAALLDAPAAEMVTPRITAMRYPFFELGRIAANDLIEIIENGPGARIERTLAPAGLVERNSTARYRGA